MPSLTKCKLLLLNKSESSICLHCSVFEEAGARQREGAAAARRERATAAEHKVGC